MIDHEDRQVVTVPRWAMLECDGDARDAMVLAQVSWWMQPSQRDGTPRTLRLAERAGETWMYLTDAELGLQLGMSRGQVQRARLSLVARGLIASMSAKVDGRKVTLVRPIIPGLRESEQSDDLTDLDCATSGNSQSRDLAQSSTTPVSRGETEPLAIEGCLSLPLSTSEQTASDRAKGVVSTAEKLLRSWWEARTPRPTQSYVGARKVLERLLDAGWTVDQLDRALPTCPVISARACELALRRAAPTPLPLRAIDSDRDLPSGTYVPDPAAEGGWRFEAYQ